MSHTPVHPSYDDSGDKGGLEPTRDARPKTPGWVKLFGVLALVLILAVAMQLILGVRHGPGLHSSYDSVAGLIPLW